MSLPVAALACKLDKNLKTFGSSLDVLFERSSARSCLPSLAAFLPMQWKDMLQYGDRVFTCRLRRFDRERVAIGKKA